ncbi:uncharacterized protein LOC116800559 [Drosophila sechellia]|uniref:uncharacterized protein LOC116800559 n=1 Tax=Drosophila sechellia TaxID=7238 RepID=UPI0013DDDA34|nr:uncharacterized protein LOC116800559 [Drosophila sechellia]
MCCNVSHQYCCVVIGVLAIIVGSSDIGYRAHLLATYGLNRWILASVIAWVLIIMAAVVLIVGAIKKITTLLLIWIIFVLLVGIAQIFIKIVLFTPAKNIHPNDAYYILAGGFIILLILLVFCSAYYPYAYKREIEEEEYE